MIRFGMIGIMLAALAQFSTPQALAQGNCTPKLGHPPLARKGMLIAAINPTVAPIQYIDDDGNIIGLSAISATRSPRDSA